MKWASVSLRRGIVQVIKGGQTRRFSLEEHDMTTTNETVGFGKLAGEAVVGGVIAAVVNVALLFGSKAAGITMTGEFQPGTVGELPLPAVIISSIVPGLVGAGLALALLKFTKAAARNFAIVAAVFTVLSLAGPVGVKQISTGTIVVMELMHVVAALGIGGALFRAMQPRA